MKISIINFYRGALLTPIFLPILLLSFDIGNFSSLILMSLWFAGLPYIFFVILGFIFIGRIQSFDREVLIIGIAPFLFLPFVLIGRLFFQWIERTSNPNLVIDAFQFIPIAVFTLLLGYAYVLLTYFVFLALRKIGVIS